MTIQTARTGQVEIPLLLFVLPGNRYRMRRLPVTVHAFCDKDGQDAVSGLMRIMTGITGHIRCLKTPACPEQL